MPDPTVAPDVSYLTPQQAGQYINLSPRTLEKMRSDGGGPRFRKLGKRIRYTKADLDSWDRVPGRGVRVVSLGSVGLVLS